MCNIFNKLCIIIENDWTFRCKLTRPVGNVDHQGLRTAPCVPSPLLLPVPRFSSLTWMWISSRASVAYHARRPGARRGVGAASARCASVVCIVLAWRRTSSVRPSSLKERVKIWATLFLLTKISRCKRSSGRRRRLARASATGRCEARTWAKPGGGDRARADPLPHLADA